MNHEKFRDDTADIAVGNVSREEREKEKYVREVVGLMKKLAEKTGLEVIEKICVRDRKTKKEYRI
ncbi:MAG TPA: hypothetical protein DDY31_01570 [Lachnospiraceae bacterium]|nr:hypothetical protein [Lachnospiraceae bacterium]